MVLTMRSLTSSLVVVMVWLMAVASRARGDCCPRTYMEWTANTCWPFQQQYYMQGNDEGDLLSSMMLPTRCEAKVCNDGRTHDGMYCGIGPCNMFGCDCYGGCFKGDAEANFRRINDIPDASGSVSLTNPTTWKWKRSNVLRNSSAGSKFVKSAYDGYKEGQLSSDKSRRDAERARKNAVTVPPTTTQSIIQRAGEKNKPRWG